MAVSFSEVRYRNFGKCLKIENAFAELLVTVELGPRIIRYALKGGDNFFFEDKARRIKEEPKAMLDYYGRGACWYIYGGHRVWQSPEYMPQTYYPDNNRVAYEVAGSTAKFTAQPQQKNGIRVSLDVTLDEYGSSAVIGNRITNITGEPKTFSVWALSVLAPGGIEIVPQNRNATGYQANRLMAFWPYADMGDRRAAWGREYFTLRQDKRAATPFKVGCDNRRGWAAYVLRGSMFLKEFDYDEEAVYPDGGMSFETYTNAHFLEMETLGPLGTAEPGETVVHTERWDIVDDVRAPKPGDTGAIEEIVNKYIGK